ncbi:hypothetical protein O1611_g7075 [Lasiodiplodia mahajangana]|uniref:Uncharacterized protein n=1 Tax=Lasiodiplodia mahajangana TaxID=1108764 RepID=A0ACC2JGS5_9PEZI|nr:hypothetical protein O1611_g7075 [Lasiodiplodia mahajangana]
MSNSQTSLEFGKTADTEPQTFRLYIALFPMGSGSLCHLAFYSDCSKQSSTDTKPQHWSLVLKDSTGAIDLLDANELDGSKKHETRDFRGMRKNHLKAICEIANLENDERVNLVRATAAAEEIPARGDNSFCRTWIINVLKSLRDKGVNLHGEPEIIQKAVQRAAGEFGMQYGPEYHVVAPRER